jgi:hypothetical protein
MKNLSIFAMYRGLDQFELCENIHKLEKSQNVIITIYKKCKTESFLFTSGPSFAKRNHYYLHYVPYNVHYKVSCLDQCGGGL